MMAVVMVPENTKYQVLSTKNKGSVLQTCWPQIRTAYEIQTTHLLLRYRNSQISQHFSWIHACGILFAKAEHEDQGQISRCNFQEEQGMKRLLVLILVLTLLVVTGTLVSADAKTQLTKSNDNIENWLNIRRHN